MEFSSLTLSLSLSTALLAGLVSSPAKEMAPLVGLSAQSQAYAAAKPKCVAGVSKVAKTPVSLVAGDKLKCVNIKKAQAGKKLLVTDKSKTCYSCHSAFGVSPYTSMNSNLRTQGYTLAPDQIMAAFNAHASEMSGATISAKEAGIIGIYLQSIK